MSGQLVPTIVLNDFRYQAIAIKNKNAVLYQLSRYRAIKVCVINHGRI
jgi:hypothetical protein